MSEAYRSAGVDIAGADDLVNRIAGPVTDTWGPNVIGGFGGFAGGFRIPAGYDHPVLLMTTDGVGTKLDIARRAGTFDGIGFDLVAMCVDDLAAAGAQPLAFTDYLAVGAIDHTRDEAIISSVARACGAAGCALIGGETAEHPGTMERDAFDLAGAAVGVAEEGALVTGSLIEPGDILIGLHSPNLRSNGFSLVRAVIGDMQLTDHFPGDHRTVAEVLLEPSVIYSPMIIEAARATTVKGLAHITGGGLIGNIPRALPDGTGAQIDRTTWAVPDVFESLIELGSLDREEMFAVFNMGVGFVIITDAASEAEIRTIATRHGHGLSVIGHVTAQDGVVELVG